MVKWHQPTDPGERGHLLTFTIVRCNVCGAWFRMFTAYRWQARREIRQRGWKRIKGRWYCPEYPGCAALIHDDET